MTSVAAELRRWYGIELRFADSSARARTLNASFNHESREQVLRTIELAVGVDIEMRGDTAVVHSRTGTSRRR